MTVGTETTEAAAHRCESCGMPIDTGRYCAYCVGPDGALQDFETRFARMVDWARRETPELSIDAAEQRTIDHMATLPAWMNHPTVLARRTR